MKPLDLRVEYAKWRNWRQKLAIVLKQMPKPKPAPRQMFMCDDVNISLIPKDAQAVAGYVGGRWPTEARLEQLFPTAHHLPIAISASENARCLDVEPGDATIAEAPAWVKRQKARGEKLPVLYTSASWGQKLVDACAAAGLRYGHDYLWWSAHYTYQPHFCGPKCGFGLRQTAHATQFTDRAQGKSLDESIVSPGFF